MSYFHVTSHLLTTKFVPISVYVKHGKTKILFKLAGSNSLILCLEVLEISSASKHKSTTK